MALNISLDKNEARPLFLQIAASMRGAIARGELTPGAQLPSSRSLAMTLDVARGTVEAAYAVLAGEGAILARGSAGMRVSGSEPVTAAEPTPFMFVPENAVQTGPLPFQIGLPGLDVFPRTLWSNLTVRAAKTRQPIDFANPDPSGLPELRQAICEYLVTRGIHCSAAQVLVTAGYQGALTLVRSVLLRHGDAAWVEDPGYPHARQALEISGVRAVPIRVDAEGLRVASGVAAAPAAKLAVVTPGHHYPTGITLSLPRRLELLKWAAEAGSWVLEDDYDSEFHYLGRSAPSLKSLDRAQRVLYAGTFSKVLFPSLRLGYLVVPPELAIAFQRAARLTTMGAPLLEQRVVAEFLHRKQFARHIRRMRTIYAERREALAQALGEVFGRRAVVDMPPGGMHLVLRFPAPVSDTVLVKQAATAGLAPSALSPLSLAHDHGQGLLLSFTNIPPDQAVSTVTRLAVALSPYLGDSPT